MLGGKAADLFLDRIELADPIDSLAGGRRAGRFMEFAEPAAKMRPAERGLDRAGGPLLLTPTSKIPEIGSSLQIRSPDRHVDEPSRLRLIAPGLSGRSRDTILK